ncbi:MAG: RHS repeat domain-containing protein, partial [Acidobacteriota bacterium]
MAAQARALILSLAALCLPAFANVPRASFVAEKPRLGGESFALASHQGQAAANALIAPGLCECLYDSGRRSRSTGKERDGETGLDCFGARYMSAAQGRFTSPDPHNIVLEASSEEEFASFLSNPQNWNRYAYVTN